VFVAALRVLNIPRTTAVDGQMEKWTCMLCVCSCVACLVYIYIYIYISYGSSGWTNGEMDVHAVQCCAHTASFKNSTVSNDRK